MRDDHIMMRYGGREHKNGIGIIMFARSLGTLPVIYAVDELKKSPPPYKNVV